MAILIRILLVLIPITIIYFFVQEYKKQKQLSEDNWSENWKQKKENFQKDQELKAKEREIEKLKNKLRDGE